MPAAVKCLGQAVSTVNNPVDLYTPAAGVSFVCSSIVVVNTTGATMTYSLSFRRGGAAAGSANQIVPVVSIQPFEKHTHMDGIAGNNADGDVLTFQASAVGLTVTAFGQELS